MQSIDLVINRESKIVSTPRVLQLNGIFDIPPSQRTAERWEVKLPLDEREWNIGLIVGPSGCGKTTLIREAFPDHIADSFDWHQEKSVLDGFPASMGIKDITGLLNSVGFSSPPSWVRPFHVLSSGEKFRVSIARALAESKELCVIDEFTSVVDRTVAQIGSSAVAKTVRRQGKKLIAVSCHYDIEEWLQPDWIYKPHESAFEWRFLQCRPKIELQIAKVHHKAWDYFKRYHYLTAELNKAAQCFVAFWGGLPVAFYSYLHFQNNRLKSTKRGHRVVCLPDYQGAGIGLKLEEYIASCLVAVGWDYIGAAAHPARIAYCVKSPNWRMIARPNISNNHGGKGKAGSIKHAGRMVTTFRYCGPSAPKSEALRLVG